MTATTSNRRSLPEALLLMGCIFVGTTHQIYHLNNIVAPPSSFAAMVTAWSEVPDALGGGGRNATSGTEREPTKNQSSKQTSKSSLMMGEAPDQLWKAYHREHLNRQSAHIGITDGQLPATFWQKRKFALIYVPCSDDRAGNFLHNVFNNVAWAIIHNRTILYEYYHHRNDSNHSCNKIIEPIPGWHAYDGYYRDALPSAVPVSGLVQWGDFDTDTEIDSCNRSVSWTPLVVYPQIRDVFHQNDQMWRAPWSRGPREQCAFNTKSRCRLPDEQQQRMNALYAQGSEYWRGLLFYNLFIHHSAPSSFNLSEWPRNESKTSNQFSIAIHSRHIVPSDDGRFISREVRCLKGILQSREETPHRNSSLCIVYVMSDREETRIRLTRWLQQNNCSVVVANFTKPVDNPPSNEVSLRRRIHRREEHGPYAGKGFFRDLYSASRARDAVVGDPERSSFALLLSLITFGRGVAYNNREGSLGRTLKKRSTEDLATCWMPRIDPRGYRYQESESPWFISDEFLEPLPPVDQLQKYKRKLVMYTTRISSDTKSKSELPSEYLVINWDGCLESWWMMAANYWHAVNDNQTVLFNSMVQTQTQTNCTVLPWHVHKWVHRTDSQNDVSLSISTPVEERKEARVMLGPAPLEIDHNISEHFFFGALFDHIMGAPPGTRELRKHASFDDVSIAVYLPPSSTQVAVPFDSNVSQALHCMSPMLHESEKCSVYLMAHDVGATDYFKAQLEQLRNCRVHTQTVARNGKGLLHGIYSLARARRGFVGPSGSTSFVSRMILTQLEFGRVQSVHERGRVPPIFPAFHTCFLPRNASEL